MDRGFISSFRPGLFAFFMLGAVVSSGFGQPRLSTGDRAEAVTRRNANVLRTLRAYQESGGPATLDVLKRTAAERDAEMENLIGTDPAAVLDSALPDDVRNAFPDAVRSLVEERVDVQEQIEVSVEDGPDYSRMHYSLVTGGSRLTLYFAGSQPENMVTGERVHIQGVRVGKAIAASTTGTTTTSSILANTFGAQKTLAILVNFQDEAMQPATSSYVSGLMFGSTSSVSAWWLENSFQQTWATGDVAGWYTIPVSSTTCDTSSIASYGNTAAQNAGYVLSNYQHLVYIFPNNACSWWGYSTIGGSPSQSWIRDYTNSTSGVALLNLTHELGHSLGLYHSHGWNCSSYPSTSCSSNEYGDTLDVMGNSSYVTAPHYDSFQKERLGWLNYSAQPPIQTVSASGTYTLAPFETQDSGVKAIKVPQANGAYYYIEYRTAAGFDGFLSGNSNVLNGVVLRLATPGSSNSSELLNISSPLSESLSPALDLGASYTDATTGVTVSPVSVGSSAAVQVTLGTAVCNPANPTISMVGPSGSVAPGTTASYSVTVKDNDSSSCSSSSFGFSSSVPSGWNGVYTASGVTLAPGASASVTLSVTAPSGTANGTYTIGAGVSNTSATSYAVSASTAETIYTPAPMSVSITTNQSSYNPGQKISTSVRVMSGTLAVSGASVTVNITKADGSVVKLNATTGSNGVATVSYQSKKNDPAGMWQDAGSYNGMGANTAFTVQ